MNIEHLIAVRDCHVLNHKQKVFLFVVISRGEDGLYAKYKRNLADMGLKKDMYYEARDSLIQNKVLTVEIRYNSTTIYHYNPSGHSEYQKSSFGTPEQSSDSQNTSSAYPETKVNKKKNKKDNEKENITSLPADAVTDEAGAFAFENEIDFSSNCRTDSAVSLRGEEAIPFSDIQNETDADDLPVPEDMLDCRDPENHMFCDGLVPPDGDWDWDTEYDDPRHPNFFAGHVYTTPRKASKARHDYKYLGVIL